MADTQDPTTIIDDIMARATTAAAVFSELDQPRTDAIVRAVYLASFAARIQLARLAVEESGIGRWEDKVIKNVIASQLVYDQIRNLPTVGVISHDERLGITEIAQPLGPIVAIIPCTNPTSTVIFKILIALSRPAIRSLSVRTRAPAAVPARPPVSATRQRSRRVPRMTASSGVATMGTRKPTPSWPTARWRWCWQPAAARSCMPLTAPAHPPSAWGRGTFPCLWSAPPTSRLPWTRSWRASCSTTARCVPASRRSWWSTPSRMPSPRG